MPTGDPRFYVNELGQLIPLPSQFNTDGMNEAIERHNNQYAVGRGVPYPSGDFHGVTLDGTMPITVTASNNEQLPTDAMQERIDALEKRLGELEKFIAQLLTVAAKRMTEL